jgi:hypothetical protein
MRGCVARWPREQLKVFFGTQAGPLPLYPRTPPGCPWPPHTRMETSVRLQPIMKYQLQPGEGFPIWAVWRQPVVVLGRQE